LSTVDQEESVAPSFNRVTSTVSGESGAGTKCGNAGENCSGGE